MRTFINENKSCAETADCTVLHGTCGITEDGCTNAVYVNNATDPMSYDFQRLRLRSCLSDFEGTESCVSCDRVPAPPTCVDGKCIGTSACALEANAIWDFKSRNDACTVDDDCTTAFVGCDVTEDGCTGAVYFAADFDRDELTKLQAELSGCSGGCSVCEREAAPPACVSGRCVIRPLR